MRRGLVVGLLLAILVGAGFYYLGLQPVLENITTVEAETEQAVQLEGTLLQARNRLVRIRDAELQYIDAVGEIERMIPTTPQQGDLITDLEALAADTAVSWKGASFTEPSRANEESELREIQVGVELEGQYFEILAYLYAVQDLERVLRLDSASFAPTEDEDGFIQLNVSLTLTAFTTSDVVLPATAEDEEG